jgi:hypothetical protein
MWHAWERKVYRVLVGKNKERDHLEDQGVDGRMRSEWILGRLAGRLWIGSSWLRIGTGGEPSGSGATELVSLNKLRHHMLPIDQ